ncbi:MAG: class I SAM-dependent methyltransferase [Deltaproteobacteria bacterium]|jgi:demethylmenaquinone methyltransferase/2-methoxy-6-polyprenyl-1,4-benzoquinol methylase|nr:class I SAM-dependent methyltransferase [Deltaproteobacteria bacterium]
MKYADKLHMSDFLRGPVIGSAIQALELPQGSSGLDAGCGIGSHTLLLAKAVGSAGHVTGLDLSFELLIHAKKRARKSSLSAQVSFQKGDVSKLPFEDDTFDWVWSADCVGYAPLEPLLLVKELARVVRPGGKIAILGWSSQQLLPGYPQLEARLNATSAGIAPFVKGKMLELHFLRALGWFNEAGLQELNAYTFAGEVHAPLTNDIRSALISLFDMRWGKPQPELSEEDREEYQRICQPESPDFIVNLSDYYAFFTYSLFSGKVVK